MAVGDSSTCEVEYDAANEQARRQLWTPVPAASDNSADVQAVATSLVQTTAAGSATTAGDPGCKLLQPCGLMANNLFNDTFELNKLDACTCDNTTETHYEFDCDKCTPVCGPQRSAQGGAGRARGGGALRRDGLQEPRKVWRARAAAGGAVKVCHLAFSGAKVAPTGRPCRSNARPTTSL